jgi:nitrogenase molybdenum-iron protein beta chain
MRQVAQPYIRYGFQKEIALVGETSNVLGVGRFLQKSFGQTLALVVITDQPDKDYRECIHSKAGFGEQVEIVFSSNGKEIDEKLAEVKPELILGSSLEQEIAGKLSVPLLKISAPAFDKLYLDQTYTGCNGAIRLVQDFAEVILEPV